MRWYEYKMEVDDLHASDDLKAKLLALQANAAETPGAKSIAMPAPSPTPKKQKKPLRFPARRWAQLAACAAVCGVCLYGAVYAYEWKGVTLLGGGSSSNYSAAATKAAAPQAAVYSMETPKTPPTVLRTTVSPPSAQRTATVQQRLPPAVPC